MTRSPLLSASDGNVPASEFDEVSGMPRLPSATVIVPSARASRSSRTMSSPVAVTGSVASGSAALSRSKSLSALSSSMSERSTRPSIVNPVVNVAESAASTRALSRTSMNEPPVIVRSSSVSAPPMLVPSSSPRKNICLSAASRCVIVPPAVTVRSRSEPLVSVSPNPAETRPRSMSFVSASSIEPEAMASTTPWKSLPDWPSSIVCSFTPSRESAASR